MTRSTTTQQRGPRKRALLVGINQYPTAPLKGCVNDVLMMGNILITHFGFTPGADMRLLVDQRATKEAILKRLEWLVEGARAGDVLVFHYSGHGSQVPDRNGDELDHIDECLVPIDHDWDDPLLDDDLGNIIRLVPDGVNLTIILDCCHSGTGTKEFGPNIPATKKRLLPPPDIRFRAVGGITIEDGFSADSVTMTSFRNLNVRHFGRSVEEQCGILITGCRDHQLSNDAFIDGDYHGALTYALFQSLEAHGVGQSYANWHRSAAALIPGYQIRNQDPQLECAGELANWRLFSTQPAFVAPAGRRLETGRTHVVYVHGICEHKAGYSNGWWRAMRPYVPDIPADNRHEVLWSDIVTPAARSFVSAQDESDVKKMITDTLHDRAVRAAMDDAPGAEDGYSPNSAGTRAVLGIPGIDCIDDFMKYLLINNIRQQVIDSFTEIVEPLIQKGHRLEIISHSWGTVVAYEALHILAANDRIPNHAIHNLFTVGSALSIGAVRRHLIEQAEAGEKPRCVEQWINLDAKNDIVGGPLKNIPYEVDFEYLNLTAVGCWPPLLNWACAHSSYFHRDNKTVQRDIFAKHINDDPLAP